MKKQDFEIQEKIATEFLLKKGKICIYKVTRAGCTWSLVKTCCLQKKKVTVICPTIRIVQELHNKLPEILGYEPRIAPVLRDAELCRRLYPNLKVKFQFKPTCKRCQFETPQQCDFQRILVEDYDVYLLTYSKLRALQTSTSPEAEELLEKILTSDVFILDEFTTAVLPDIPTLTVKSVDKDGED